MMKRIERYHRLSWHSVVVLVAASLLLPIHLALAQNPEVNTRVVDCPNSVPPMMGYDQISSINSDQQEELQRIQNGSPPRPPYVFRLCPNTQFDASTAAPLNVLLSGSMFTCGPNTASTDNCVISGGVNQVLIEDSTIDGYSLDRTSFVGITFEGFTGASVNGFASFGTTATFMDTKWRNFAGNYVINLGTEDGVSDGQAMTVEISDNSVVEASLYWIRDIDRNTSESG